MSSRYYDGAEMKRVLSKDEKFILKPSTPREKMNVSYWEVKRDGKVLAHGPKYTMPTAAQIKSIRSGGLKIYVEGKLYREDKR